MTKQRLGFAVVVLAATLAVVRLADTAQADTKYVEQDKVFKVMMQWNKDLGVKCEYCHTADKKQTIESLEGQTAKSDELQSLMHRRSALDMEGMVQMVNAKQNAEMTCATCHQGSPTIDLTQK